MPWGMTPYLQGSAATTALEPHAQLMERSGRCQRRHSGLLRECFKQTPTGAPKNLPRWFESIASPLPARFKHGSVQAQRPVPRNTTIAVRRMSFVSSQKDSRRSYRASQAARKEKMLSLRAVTCQMPVKPGRRL